MDNDNARGPYTTGELPRDTRIDDRAIKKIAGEAIAQVGGVLGMAGGLADVLLPGDERIRGLTVTYLEGGSIEVSARLITEYGKNIPALVAAVQYKVTEALHSMAGLDAEKVEVEVTDTMTREEYHEKMEQEYGLE